MKHFAALLFSFALLLLSGAAHAQSDPPDLIRLRTSYDGAVQRATKPINETYLAELIKQRDALTKAGRLEEAVAFANEIKIIKARLGLPADKDAPMAPAAAPLAADEKEITIPANSPDGYALGAVKKGDAIRLQYVSGKWKDHGSIATENPDDPKGASEGNPDDDRVAIAEVSDKGLPGKLIKVVPGGTRAKPFSYVFQTTRSNVVLRINSKSDDKRNPGAVVYRVKISR